MTALDGASSRTQWDAQIGLAVGAAVLTLALTAVSFWLSYEGLHDLARAHRLHGERAWAWPATVDSFIGVGELLILRASLRGVVDRWAIALTAVGSLGSIALNVAGVGVSHDPLDYVTAAVPPVAALLAFGVLMRQIHEFLLSRHPVVTAPDAPVKPEPAEPVKESEEAVHTPVDKPVVTLELEPVREPDKPEEPLTARAQADEIVRGLYDDLGNRRPTTGHIVSALRDAGFRHSDGTARSTRLRIEAREPKLKELPSA
ncbi:DUF2637 domain-containing protein [Streptomyces sp. NPDC056653]|uniref:DUF2637 domain-containing protein n=1 Tax=Streptomyces sp. NPDC056653 TaxID=3345894 RepID=UPI0036C3EDD0